MSLAAQLQPQLNVNEVEELLRSYDARTAAEQEE